MRADSDSFSTPAERAAEGWPPFVHAAAAALLIGLVGCFGTLQVWVLALIGGSASFSIARRDGAEPAAADRSATLLKLAFITVLCAAAFDNRVQRIDLLRPSPSAFAAFVLIAAGLVLRRLAMRALGDHFTIKVVLRADHRLVESGPYRSIRHPNYTGLVLVMLGTAVVLQSPLALAAVVFVWLPALLLRIKHEEAVLLQHFGDAYRSYTQRTRRLVPGIY